MSTILTIFTISFASTFLGAYQVRNIAGGHVLGAFFTSIIYSSVFAILYRLMPTASWTEIAAYACGTALGVVTSMRLHIMIHGGK